MCLDFINTLAWRGRAAPVESLGDFADLTGWLARRGGLPQQVVAAAEALLRDHSDRASALCAETIATREALCRMFSAVAGDVVVAADDLAALNAALAVAPPRTRLIAWDGAFAWAVEPGPLVAPLLLAPVLWSAADLIAGAARARVRRCANEECLWLFVDHSKGGTRRWCDMRSCGNRAKAQRHYRRLRTPRPGRAEA